MRSIRRLQRAGRCRLARVGRRRPRSRSSRTARPRAAERALTASRAGPDRADPHRQDADFTQEERRGILAARPSGMSTSWITDSACIPTEAIERARPARAGCSSASSSGRCASSGARGRTSVAPAAVARRGSSSTRTSRCPTPQVVPRGQVVVRRVRAATGSRSCRTCSRWHGRAASVEAPDAQDQVVRRENHAVEEVGVTKRAMPGNRREAPRRRAHGARGRART